MSRIPPVNPATASPEQKELFATIKKAIGGVPNLLATLGQSTAAAQAYLAFSQALSHGVLSSVVREQIALTVGQANACNYCLAAHTALGARAGLTAEQIQLARHGQSSDPRTTGLLTLARRIVETRGLVSDGDLAAARSVGASDAELTEVVANVALNLYTNYFNHVAETTVDFPAAPALAA